MLLDTPTQQTFGATAQQVEIRHYVARKPVHRPLKSPPPNDGPFGQGPQSGATSGQYSAGPIGFSGALTRTLATLATAPVCAGTSPPTSPGSEA
eukprot:5445055-Amphidinium_carterae.1